MKRKGTPGLWSVTRIKDPRYPGILLRVTELRRDGPLFVARQVNGKPRYTKLSPEVTRRSLGDTPKEQQRKAKAIALGIIERLATEPETPDTPRSRDGKLTLGQLVRRYQVDGAPGRTKRYRDGVLLSVKRVRDFLGADLAVSDLRPSHVSKYMAHRAAQGVLVAGRADLVMLSIVLNWAVGEEMLDVNPLAREAARKAMRLDGHEPRRPVATSERYEALKGVAGQLPPAFGVLLALAWHAGHRVSAMLGSRDGEFSGLRWRDVSFDGTDAAPYGAITWYAGVRPDRKKHPHTVAMNEQASATLARWQRETGGLGARFVFANARGGAISYYDAKRWLKRAESLAGLAHVRQGGWHALRRGWATCRKHLPIQDVAEAGGWRDEATPAQIYQQADASTTRAVALHIA